MSNEELIVYEILLFSSLKISDVVCFSFPLFFFCLGPLTVEVGRLSSSSVCVCIIRMYFRISKDFYHALKIKHVAYVKYTCRTTSKRVVACENLSPGTGFHFYMLAHTYKDKVGISKSL